MLRNAYSVLKDLPSDAYGDDGTPDAAPRETAVSEYNERGITSIGDRGASVAALKLYRAARSRRADRTGQCHADLSPPFGDRSTIVSKLNELADYPGPGEPNGPTGVGDHWVRIGPMKVFIDGGMLNGTAFMREPWGVGETYQITEPDYRGLLFIQPDTLATIAEEAARRGWQMTAHCAGEAGMDDLLAAYLQADQSVGNSPPPLADHSCQLHVGART